MIVGSLLLILVAVALLVLGLAGGSSVLLISSIAASLLAAVALVAGARQAAAARSAAAADGTRVGDDAGWSDPFVFDERSAAAERPGAGRRFAGGPFRRSGRDATGTRSQPAATTTGAGWQPTDEPPIPTQHTYADAGRAPAGAPGPYDGFGPETVEPRTSAAEDRDGDPADEPAAQPVSSTDAALLARLPDEVFVVDGRPRYHLSGCPYLSGRATEPLPVSEAVELGFTPCAACEPAAALLADPRRV